MTSIAPACPISRSQPTQKTPQPPGAIIATIPPVHNLRTVINAINQMNTVVQHITRTPTQINNVSPPTEAGIPPPQLEQPPAPQYDRLTWLESGRGYTTQKIVNPDDDTQSVEIKTLSHVTWTEQATGHTLRYNRGS